MRGMPCGARTFRARRPKCRFFSFPDPLADRVNVRRRNWLPRLAAYHDHDLCGLPWRLVAIPVSFVQLATGIRTLTVCQLFV